VCFPAEPTSQVSTAAAHAQWTAATELPQKVGGLRVIPIFSGLGQKARDFVVIAARAAINQRYREMILGFLLAEFRRVIGLDSLSV